MELLQELKKIFVADEEEMDRDGLSKKIMLLGIIGLVLLFAGNLFSITSEPQTKPGNNIVEEDRQQLSDFQLEETAYEQQLARELEELLTLINGVGRVRVQLKADQSTGYEYEYRLRENNKITNEVDQNAGERRIEETDLDREPVIIRDSGGQEAPLVRVKKNPEITGVIIVAEGVEDSSVRYNIYRAVSSFLELPVHKINVLPHERR